jgi:hypothetical protein
MSNSTAKEQTRRTDRPKSGPRTGLVRLSIAANPPEKAIGSSSHLSSPSVENTPREAMKELTALLIGATKLRHAMSVFCRGIVKDLREVKWNVPIDDVPALLDEHLALVDRDLRHAYATLQHIGTDAGPAYERKAHALVLQDLERTLQTAAESGFLSLSDWLSKSRGSEQDWVVQMRIPTRSLLESLARRWRRKSAQGTIRRLKREANGAGKCEAEAGAVTTTSGSSRPEPGAMLRLRAHDGRPTDVGSMPSPPRNWSIPLPLKNWAEIFGVSERMPPLHAERTRIPFEEITRQQWRADLDALTPGDRQRYEPVAAVTREQAGKRRARNRAKRS